VSERLTQAKYCIIGDPVAHSLSPAMQTAAFAAAGIDALYEALRVAAGSSGGAIARLRDLGYAGFNVTTPLKEEVREYLDECSELAREAGAVNTVARRGDALVGHNTDGEGCVRALDDLWRTALEDADVLLLGAGPAARAIALSLRSRGARIACWARREERAASIGPPPARRATVVISALAPDAELPAEVIAAIDPQADILDVNYGTARSPIPSDVGARRSDGIPMLLHQGALAFEWWTGTVAPLAAMRAALDRAKGRAEPPRTENRPR
jgi:shikimate dehydrogenase